MLEKAGVSKAVSDSDLPASVDLRWWCSPVEYQGQLESFTANAGVDRVGYYERMAFGKYIDKYA